ncbi:hypothetical protein R1sor_000626 [Riccia sorocarpa]|uniref:BTB domain-containing protein n=1 Tax=Riccia sorocarpa TaxID=122646 RepID=A0ABD3GW52_9MARC
MSKSRVLARSKLDSALDKRVLVATRNQMSNKLRFLREYDSSPLSKEFRGDIKFVGSNGEEVYAHKFIMIGRSLVLRRMFEGDTKEKENGIVQCPDTSGPVLRSMVNFCYTAEIDFTEEVPAKEVIKIAHMFDIQYLKAVCEDELIHLISTDCVCDMSMLARKYDAKELNGAVADFFRECFDDVYPLFAERLCALKEYMYI